MKAILVILILSVSIFAQAKQPDNASQFWNSLQKLCGKAFAGTVAAAPPEDTTFKDKKLVMHLRSCEKNVIRIPFFVGEDKSRTWVLTRQKNGRILLKHDHRHEDGTPDKVTMYGGLTSNFGSPTRQIFPADDETVKVIPAASNVWWIDLVDGDYFSYNLRRMGTDRFFSIKFDLRNPIQFSEVPWGFGKSKAKNSVIKM